MHVLGKKPTKAKTTAKEPAAPQDVSLERQGVVQPSNADQSAVIAHGLPAPAVDALDRFEKAGVERAIMLMFWTQRHREPSFSLAVDLFDLKGFEECIAYLEVEPRIQIVRPRGLPPQDAIPATAKRSGIPPRAAKPPKDYVVIQMVDKDGNAIVPVENNEHDHALGEEARKLKRIRDTAPLLAAQLLQDLQQNTTSSSTIQQAADALKALAA